MNGVQSIQDCDLCVCLLFSEASSRAFQSSTFPRLNLPSVLTKGHILPSFLYLLSLISLTLSLCLYTCGKPDGSRP